MSKAAPSNYPGNSLSKPRDYYTISCLYKGTKSRFPSFFD